MSVFRGPLFSIASEYRIGDISQSVYHVIACAFERGETRRKLTNDAGHMGMSEVFSCRRIGASGGAPGEGASRCQGSAAAVVEVTGPRKRQPL